MTVKELKDKKIITRNAIYLDINGKDITYKSPRILDLLEVIGTSHFNDSGNMIVDVRYEDYGYVE